MPIQTNQVPLTNNVLTIEKTLPRLPSVGNFQASHAQRSDQTTRPVNESRRPETSMRIILGKISQDFSKNMVQTKKSFDDLRGNLFNQYTSWKNKSKKGAVIKNQEEFKNIKRWISHGRGIEGEGAVSIQFYVPYARIAEYVEEYENPTGSGCAELRRNPEQTIGLLPRQRLATGSDVTTLRHCRPLRLRLPDTARR